MSENNSTNTAKILSDEEKITIRFEINELKAKDILAQIDAPFPEISDIDEIHLLIKP